MTKKKKKSRIYIIWIVNLCLITAVVAFFVWYESVPDVSPEKVLKTYMAHGVKMIIKSIMTDEDRKALEYMLSLEYAMPYQLLKTKNNRRKIIYIMTPVLFLLSIGCYFVKSYPMFYVGMGISIIALIWIIWFQSKGKKFENNVHEFVWNKSRYNKVEIDVQGIKLEDKKICELKEIDRVFLYKGFFFLITNEKKLLVLKTVGVETEELIKIIKEADILFEKREEPFNIYEYCKK